MTTLSLWAPAKVNLCLEVLGRRRDGYHEVRTVLQAVDLADRLTFELDSALSLVVEPPGAVAAEGNLALRAAELLQQEAGVTAGALITLSKQIPVAVGLGGGSSDAAATLLGLRRLWGLDLSEQRLLALAARLGSDVPFFIRGGTALGSGRGTELTRLPTPSEGWAVLLIPQGTPQEDKTARLYALLTPADFMPGASHSDNVVRRLHSRRPLSRTLFNVFESVAPVAYPSYAAHRNAFGDADVLLAGAGPAFFALAADEAEARGLQTRLVDQGYRAHAVCFLPPWDLAGVPFSG
jgi:4-diphosphocytidyl-2-C-methyl-D-erythritol kinase